MESLDRPLDGGRRAFLGEEGTIGRAILERLAQCVHLRADTGELVQ
jgi:hypothetical protein